MKDTCPMTDLRYKIIGGQPEKIDKQNTVPLTMKQMIETFRKIYETNTKTD